MVSRSSRNSSGGLDISPDFPCFDIFISKMEILKDQPFLPRKTSKKKAHYLPLSTSTRPGSSCSNSKGRYQDLCAVLRKISAHLPDVENYSLTLVIKNGTDSLKLNLVLWLYRQLCVWACCSMGHLGQMLPWKVTCLPGVCQRPGCAQRAPRHIILEFVTTHFLPPFC